MQTTSKAMLEDIRSIRRSLESNFQDKNDGYTRKMFRFSAVADEELQEVRDGIVQAEKSLRDVQTYFGEGEEMGRPLQSQDFFGIFRTFTSSWKVSAIRRIGLDIVLMKSSFAERRTGLDRRKWLSENDGRGLVLYSHLKSRAAPIQT